ncbi:HEPN domain-containing protein [Sutcliffiella cohnii]|uniref:HEPN domain-containing protein n=1 Tax=Sutcliffiella cohnii TaxID=33932 RepID=UPI002E1CAEDC|nr:MAE_28990/MAE_18760 family HEPN-like nuclease [Sutcliffiella cohnii]
MRYQQLENDFKSITSIFELEEQILNNLSPENKAMYKKMVHKNIVIEVYTLWESFVKSLVYDCYKDYKKFIMGEKFFKQYFKSVQENSFVRKKFLKSISDDGLEITIETLCHSNNLNEKVLRELFTRITFNIGDLFKHINTSKGLNNKIESLRNSSIPPVYHKEEDIDEGNEAQLTDDPQVDRYIDTVFGYLNTLIELRNQVAHSYIITEIYDIDALKILAEFIYELCFVLLEYCGSQIIKKSIDFGEPIIKRLYPMKVFMNTSKCRAILGINNLSNKPLNKGDTLYLFNVGEGIYKIATIRGIQGGGKIIDELLPYHTGALEIWTEGVIRKEHNTFYLYDIVAPKSSETDYKYSLLI